MRTLTLALILSAAAAPALAQQATPSAQQLHLRYLTWPGKVTAPRPRQAQPQPSQPGLEQAGPAQAAAAQPPRDLAWTPAYRPVQHGANHYLGQVTPAQAAAIESQRAADRAETEKAMALAEAAKAKAEAEQKQAEIRPAPLPPAALPNSIYAAPPPAQAQPSGAARMAAGGAPYDQHARFYSLHRAFGQTPDPIALSPQFLASPSADLADPPPPPPPRIMPGQTATAAQQTAARVQARDASSD